MIEDDFYSTTGPAEWASPPTVFSYSALHAIRTCPLQWQLLHSKYGHNLRRFPARPASAAAEGNIVHSVLEKLFRALSLLGLPELGSPEFSECIARMNVKEQVVSRMSAHEQTVAEHPRGNGFRLRLSSQQLVNKIIRLFRQQYSNLSLDSNNLPRVAVDASNCFKNEHKNSNPVFWLEKFGVLSECKLKHPIMPFVGVIDLVYTEEKQPVLVDFKTGNQSEDHIKQVMAYAVLWWSLTRRVPKRLEIRYPQTVNTLKLNSGLLVEAENHLCSEIDTALVDLSVKPANALPGELCGFCDVRQFCESFWKKEASKSYVNDGNAKFIDIAITVDGTPTNFGFTGKTNNGDEFAVVFAENSLRLHTDLRDGQKLRILSGLAKGNEIIVKPKTEIYHL